MYTDGRSRCSMYAVNFTALMEQFDMLMVNTSWPTQPCIHGWEYNRVEVPYSTIATEVTPNKNIYILYTFKKSIYIEKKNKQTNNPERLGMWWCRVTGLCAGNIFHWRRGWRTTVRMDSRSIRSYSVADGLQLTGICFWRCVRFHQHILDVQFLPIYAGIRFR